VSAKTLPLNLWFKRRRNARGGRELAFGVSLSERFGIWAIAGMTAVFIDGATVNRLLLTLIR
jgi:hypothetical protein